MSISAEKSLSMREKVAAEIGKDNAMEGVILTIGCLKVPVIEFYAEDDGLISPTTLVVVLRMDFKCAEPSDAEICFPPNLWVRFMRGVPEPEYWELGKFKKKYGLGGELTAAIVGLIKRHYPITGKYYLGKWTRAYMEKK